MKRIHLFFTILFFIYSSAFADSAFKRIGQVIVSADGKHIAYLITENKSYSLFLDDQTTSTSLIGPLPSISNIAWSADGKNIYYLAKGKKFQSIWYVNVKSRIFKKILETTHDIQTFKWSPNNKHLAFLAGERLYLFSQGHVQPITSDQATIPTFFGAGFDWSSNNRSLTFSFQPQAGEDYLNDSKLAIFDVFTHEITYIPFTQDYTGVQPRYSHDGKWIAFRTNREPTTVAAVLNNDIKLQGRICVYHVASQETTCLASPYNESPSIIGWNKTNNLVYVIDTYKTIGHEIYALNIHPNIPAKNISQVEGFIQPLSISLNESGTLFGFSYETPIVAPEVFTSLTKPFKLEKVSQQQDSSKTVLGKVSTIHWYAKDGVKIEGLLITPANFNPHKKYPLFVAVHEGPASVWNQRYLGHCDNPIACWERIQHLGFIIFAPNPRGSTGYGNEFRLGNFADIGGRDFKDIMSGVDFLIKKRIADPKRLAIGGWNFGGYMTAWAMTQTKRFKVAIDGEGTVDLKKWEDFLAKKESPATPTKTTPALLILNDKKDVRTALKVDKWLSRALS